MAASINIILLTALALISTSVCVVFKGKFIQIGDMHYDPTYGDAGDSCNTNLTREKRKPYGNYECDAPLRLINSSIHEANQHVYEADFIMWAGDISSHVREVGMLDEDKVLDVLNSTSHLIREGISKEIPIFPMIGNHDYFPKSQLPASDGLYKKIANIFCPIFNLDGDGGGCNKFMEAGYYSHLLDSRVGKLKLLMLNTNLYSNSNKQIAETNLDPAGQFAWMKDQLLEARDNRLMVHVFAHIPPGMIETDENSMMFKESYNRKFNEIIRDFSDVIIGVYSAHTHTDSFRIYYKDGKPVVTLLISPSVTPWRWPGGSAPPRNPALRVIKYENNDGNIYLTDYDQYYLDLKKANEGTVVWSKEYTFTLSYEVAKNVSAEALHAVLNNFRKFANDDFHNYFERNSVQINKAEDKPLGIKYACSLRCKWVHLCTIQHVDLDPYNLCLDDITSGISVLHKSTIVHLAIFCFVIMKIFV